MDLKIEKMRKDAGYTRQFVSDAIGITEATLFNYEKGITTPTLAKAERIAAFFGCSVDALLGREEIDQ